MNEYIKPIDIRWADLDPNFHLRHSVYYDYGAYCRVCFLEEHGLSNITMQELNLGPILFREEAVFRKEVRRGDKIIINLKLLKARKDFSRWSIKHEIIKNENVLSTVITVDGAWINTVQRRLATPEQIVTTAFEEMPRDEKFEWM